MSKFNWKELVKNIAPTLGHALGGPLVGNAVSAISKAVLGRDDGTEAEIEQALQKATPEQFAAIRKADQEYETKLAELGIDLERVHAGDRDSARKRAVAMNDHSPVIIGAMILIFWGFISWRLLTLTEPPVIGDFTVGRILGMLDSAVFAFLCYLYGTSAGSQKKTALLAEKK